MKKQFTLLSIIAAATGLCLSLSVNAQNTFPASGNVSIGMTGPAKLLQLGNNSDGEVIRIGRTDNTHTVGIGATGFNSNLLFYANGAEKMRIDVNGNVGVGTTNTSVYKLNVATSLRGLDVQAGGSWQAIDFSSDLVLTNLQGSLSAYGNKLYIGSGGPINNPSVGTVPFQTINLSTGNVGINNSSPSAKLQVTNGSVLFDGTTGTTPVSGAGTRMMWIPAKGAFRAGNVTGNAWDDGNVAPSSFAVGTNTIANGIISFAAGVSTTASGWISFAAGGGTMAQSFCSFVLGQYNYNPGTYNISTWVPTEPLFVIGNGQSATATSNAVTVLKNGNTGIGTTLANNPNNYKLAVAGIIGAKVEVMVENISTTWPDYVFESSYERKDFMEKELFLIRNKHLPGIDSEKEISKNGLQMSKTLAGITMNLEENTLDIIDLSKQNAELKNELEKLKREIEELKKK